MQMGKPSFSHNGVVYTMLHMSTLFPDPAYQRTELLDTSRCRKISLDWDWRALTPLKVVKRGKKYAILDGLHRFVAAQLRFPDGNISLPAIIIKCDDIKKEADVFIKSSTNSKNLTANSIFKAMVTRGDRAARSVVRTLRQRGISIAYGRGRMSPNQTKCPAAFLDAYRVTGSRRFGLLADVIRQYERPDRNDNTIETEALKSVFVKGLAAFLAGAIDRPDAEVKRGLQNGWSAAEVMDWVHAKEDGRTGRSTRNALVVNALGHSFEKGLRP